MDENDLTKLNLPDDSSIGSEGHLASDRVQQDTVMEGRNERTARNLLIGGLLGLGAFVLIKKGMENTLGSDDGSDHHSAHGIGQTTIFTMPQHGSTAANLSDTVYAPEFSFGSNLVWWNIGDNDEWAITDDGLLWRANYDEAGRVTGYHQASDAETSEFGQYVAEHETQGTSPVTALWLTAGQIREYFLRWGINYDHTAWFNSITDAMTYDAEGSFIESNPVVNGTWTWLWPTRERRSAESPSDVPWEEVPCSVTITQWKYSPTETGHSFFKFNRRAKRPEYFGQIVISPEGFGSTFEVFYWSSRRKGWKGARLGALCAPRGIDRYGIDSWFGDHPTPSAVHIATNKWRRKNFVLSEIKNDNQRNRVNRRLRSFFSNLFGLTAQQLGASLGWFSPSVPHNDGVHSSSEISSASRDLLCSPIFMNSVSVPDGELSAEEFLWNFPRLVRSGVQKCICINNAPQSSLESRFRALWSVIDSTGGIAAQGSKTLLNTSAWQYSSAAGNNTSVRSFLTMRFGLVDQSPDTADPGSVEKFNVIGTLFTNMRSSAISTSARMQEEER